MTNTESWDRIAAQRAASTPSDVVQYGPDGPGEDDLRLIGDVAGKRVLDLGCGDGQAAGPAGPSDSRRTTPSELQSRVEGVCAVRAARNAVRFARNESCTTAAGSIAEGTGDGGAAARRVVAAKALT